MIIIIIINNILGEGLKENNNKPFWKFINSQRKENVGIGPLKANGSLHSDSLKKAQILNEQFTSVFTREDTTEIPNLPGPHFPPIPNIEINTNGVFKLLSNIQSNKAAGPDKIPCRILKELATELAPVLTHIFSHSLNQGKLPADWKNAIVAPIFKKGNANMASNYRPVSLTCVCCKLLEHILCSHIMSHLDEHNILSSLQHGFRAKHSCDTQLLTTTHDLMKSFDNKKQVDVAVLDFSKAFDKVPHERLLAKLQHYGIVGPIHSWIGEFLKGRSQCVLVEGEQSAQSDVLSGVPQGSVLGPALFLLYINDLPDQITSKARLFADDCLVYREINSASDQDKLQKDLTILENWSTKWGMQFNPSKCTILKITRKQSPLLKFYSLNGVILQHANDATYLGVTITSDLSWSKHIQQTVGKSNSMLGLLRRNLYKCPNKLRETAYFSLIRSRLEYCSAIWDPYLQKDINLIERVQRRAARFVRHDYNWNSSVTEMVKELKWHSLAERRRDIRLTLMYKIIHGKVAVPVGDTLIKSDSRTRSSHLHKFKQISSNCEQYRHSYFVSTIPEWNKLSSSVVEANTIAAFKTGLRSTSP